MNSPMQRSTFVTVLAWVFIVLSGFGTLISILQNIMVQTMFSTPELQAAMQAPPPPGTPAFASFLLAHFQWFFLLFLAFSATTLAASIALLRRRNWGRLLFVGLMVFGILWNLGGLALQFAMFGSMRQQFQAAPGAPDMGPFFIAMAVATVLFALGFSALFGWIAKRLLSPQVASEFAR
jgi:hypothetical protein